MKFAASQAADIGQAERLCDRKLSSVCITLMHGAPTAVLG